MMALPCAKAEGLTAFDGQRDIVTLHMPYGPALDPPLETMILIRQSVKEANASRLFLQQRGAGQPRPRPARTASTMSTAAQNARSISKCVVSSKCASDAG